jgi:hypothetical protein
VCAGRVTDGGWLREQVTQAIRRIAWVGIALALVLSGCAELPPPPCETTPPNGSLPPGEQAASPDYLGNGALWTVLWPQGQVIFEPGGPGEMRPDGSLAMKFPFWRGEGVVGHLAVTGERLDGEAPAMWGEITEGYGDTGFQATALVFPAAGCWRVSATAGGHELTFTLEVVVRSLPGN